METTLFNRVSNVFAQCYRRLTLLTQLNDSYAHSHLTFSVYCMLSRLAMTSQTNRKLVIIIMDSKHFFQLHSCLVF